ncbi:TrlF family AAA-like ATPase [Comamonas testosteroni]|uniref:Phosphotransferase n=1 Tax=Comamonas testosteroni TaxID=285 RepID=A0A096FMI0_COMTE|nr:AAA family ATPase [Comamonas testosteroni]KGH31089.1 phosphotransferase [Comamonas testosteroni]
MLGKSNPGGAKWHRWDPHIHAPGTILNNQYRSEDAWGQFLAKLEGSAPRIRAIGITDYYSVDTYVAVREQKQAGRLPDVDLIFANVEMRYGIGTSKGSPINVHLLVSPEDPDHVEQIRRFLRALTFEAYGETFRCDASDLIRLGRAHDNSILDDRVALAVGTNQFKVSPEQLRTAWKGSTWVQENVLVAVAAGSTDGSSGLQSDASLAILRKEIERFAHIIFSSQPKQREFWLGRGAVSIDKLSSDWNGCKPCLHGSDAHAPEQVGEPQLDRYCWIKGDVSFDSLRQVCLEPGTRAFIGASPPRGALPSHVIASISLTDAQWMSAPSVPLNPGLVGIIGARGSGKTALADLIAAAGFALSGDLDERSFVRRARRHLDASTAKLVWEDGTPTEVNLSELENAGLFGSPRVQYLSQQFVDRLCSAEGMTDELLAELERIIYMAHPSEDRMGSTTFRELLELNAAHGRSMRQSHEEVLAETTTQLNLERGRRAALPELQRQRAEKAAGLAKDRKDRDSLIGQGGEERAKQFDVVSNAAEAVRSRIEQARRRRQALGALRDEVADTRANKAPLRLRQLQQAHTDAGLGTDAWKSFLMDFSGDVDGILTAAIKTVDAQIMAMMGTPFKETDSGPGTPPSNVSLLPDGANLSQQTLGLLEREAARLRALINVDEQASKAFKRLSEKISRDAAALVKLDRDIAMANHAETRIKELIDERRTSYAAIFDGILEEEKELSALYEPLKHRLEAEDGALGKLAFSIRRAVDLEAWAQRGEELLDLRKAGPFKGRGALLAAARAELLTAWEGGTSAEVAKAMADFRASHEAQLLDHSPVERSDAEAFREWGGRISAWLYGTDHIKITYGVQYEGVDIEQLSPGTRGIVLLLLYLAIDQEDDRPLIVDQPEENLDPKSIFDELVERFRKTRLRRQIIIVTHNANLIVNTDADQVIVAKCGPHRPGQLPEISYQSGGLENPNIRRQVCEILEGGEAAFKERARRLRVRM